MRVTIIKSGLAAGVVALGLIAVGVEPATAVTYTVSDKINFTATAGPTGPGTYNIQSQQCTIVSDTEATTNCQLSGQLTMSSSGSFSSTVTVTSGDGNTQASQTYTVSGSNYIAKGRGTESDAPEPGQPPPPTYPCKAKTVGTITPLPNIPGFSLTGTMTVKETSTQP